MVSAQEQVRQIKHGVADLINEQDLVKKIGPNSARYSFRPYSTTS